MDIGLIIAIIALVGLITIGFGWLKVGKRRMAGTMIVLVIAMLISGIFSSTIGGFLGFEPKTLAVGDIGSGDRNMVDFGKASTVTLNSYDQEANSETEVYPEYYVVNSAGDKLLNGIVANTTSTTVGEVISVYGSGEDATYYLDIKKDFTVLTEAPTMSLEAHTIVTETNLAITGYDDALNGLTADDSSNNTADYNLGNYGADESNSISLKFRNGQANSLMQLGAICVGWGGDVDEIKLTESGWYKDGRGVPKELDDATVSHKNDTNQAQTVDWKECYVPYSATFASTSSEDRVVEFHQYDDQYFEFEVVAGSTAPTADTGDVAIVGFFDIANEKGKDGLMYFDYFVHDDNEEVTDVGLSEDSTANAYGLDTAVALELQ